MAKRTQLTDDEAARVSAVFTTHQTFIEAVAARHAPTPADVPDIVQSVGVKMCIGLNGFRSESEITTWLYRITVNAARTHYKREYSFERTRATAAVQSSLGNDGPAVGLADDATLDPDDQVEANERLQALEEALAQLLPAEQDAIRYKLQDRGVLSSSRWDRYRGMRRLRRLLADDPRLV